MDLALSQLFVPSQCLYNVGKPTLKQTENTVGLPMNSASCPLVPCTWMKHHPHRLLHHQEVGLWSSQGAPFIHGGSDI